MDKKEILNYLESQQDFLNSLSDSIWDAAETCYQEFVSSDILCTALEQTGFHVERDVAGIQTAFKGIWGKGKPVIGFLGEFDALSGMSQEAGSLEKKPRPDTKNGHGCGHNLLGVGSLAGAMGLKKYLEENHLEGTVVYFGCPAEEGGSGKTFMAREGCFQGLDCALIWHPSSKNAVSAGSYLANYQVYYRFKGISAHAAAAPYKGRSALDAAELMNVGVQFLREHVIPEARIHYAITNTGGFSPNVVQDSAEVLYLMRAPRNEQVEELYGRINKIARGAALMTETEVEIDFVKGCSNIIDNTVLAQAMYDNFKEIPLPQYTEEEYAFAAELAKTVPPYAEATRRRLAKIPDDRISSSLREELMRRAGEPICTFVIPYSPSDAVLPASTDVGDVSWNVPLAQCATATWVSGTPEHSWQAVTVGKSSIAHKGALMAGKVLAATAIDLVCRPELVEKAKLELKRRLEGSAYQCPIPAGVKPRSIAK